MSHVSPERRDQISSELLSLSGRDTLVLDDPQRGWSLVSGEVAVFISALVDGRAVGPRQYLLTVQAGDALFGAVHRTDDGHTQVFLATALKPAQLRSLALKDLTCAETRLPPQVGSAASDVRTLHLEGIEAWIDQLTEVLVQGANFVHAPRSSHLGPHTLEAEQALGTVAGTVNWVRLQSGRMTICGVDRQPVDTPNALVALGREGWIVAQDVSHIVLADTEQIAQQQQLAEGLRQLHVIVFQECERRRQQEQEAERLRLWQRRQDLSQQTSAVLREVGATLQKAPSVQRAEHDLLTALAAVGDRLNLTFQVPHPVDLSHQPDDAVEMICRGSRIPYRRVKLRGDWYRADAGCLLTYTRADRQPVALLPTGDSRYELFDPRTLRRSRVDTRTAAALSSDAWMFYRPFPDEMQSLWDVYRFVLPSVGKDLAFMLLLTTCGVLVGMLAPQIMQQFIDQALPNADRGLIFQLLVGLLAVSLGQTLFTLLQGVMMARLQTLSTSALQAALWDRLLRLPMRLIREYSSGDLMNRCSIVAEISQALSSTVLRTVLTGGLSLLNFAVLFSFSPHLALTAVIIIGTLVGTTVFLASRIRIVAIELEKQSSRQFGFLVQLVTGIAKLRVAGAELRAYNQWIRQYAQQLRTQSRLQWWQSAGFVFNFVLPVLSTLVLYATATNLISQSLQSSAGAGGGSLSMGGFWAFMSGFGMLLGGATGFSTSLIEIMDSLAKFRLAHPILTARLEVAADQRDPGRLIGAIALDDVTFRYQPGSPLILNHLSLRVNPGEFVAIVGKSGSGKSTLFRLLLGFETPETGRVLYDRQDLLGLDIGAIRRQVGVVLQSAKINASTIHEAIAGDRQMSLEEAWACAEEAGLADDIRGMPMGLHTMVNEGGTTLSGGQRQRLMIARALASEAKILLLDEATSALDNLSQERVSESLRRRKVTRISIAHRLSTIRHADRIYVLENGQIAQSGTFSELTNTPGPFLQMMERQLD